MSRFWEMHLTGDKMQVDGKLPAELFTLVKAAAAVLVCGFVAALGGSVLAEPAHALRNEPLPQSCFNWQTMTTDADIDRIFRRRLTLGKMVLPEIPADDRSILEAIEAQRPQQSRRRRSRTQGSQPLPIEREPGVWVWPEVSRRLNHHDILWLARMVYCEAPGQSDEHLAMLQWAIVQRLAVAGARRRAMDLVGLIQDFSQPLNEDWREGGRHCPTDRQIQTAQGEERVRLQSVRQRYASYCTQAHFERRSRCPTRPWQQIPGRYRRAALYFALGRLPNTVPAVTNFSKAFGVGQDCRGSTESVFRYDPPGRTPQEPGSEKSAVFCLDQRAVGIAPRIDSPVWMGCTAPAEMVLDPAPPNDETRAVMDEIHRLNVELFGTETQ